MSDKLIGVDLASEKDKTCMLKVRILKDRKNPSNNGHSYIYNLESVEIIESKEEYHA